MAEDASIDLSSENDTNGANITGLRKVEDGSVVSNLHTSKWRVFTDNGRDFFLQASIIHIYIDIYRFWLHIFLNLN